MGEVGLKDGDSEDEEEPLSDEEGQMDDLQGRCYKLLVPPRRELECLVMFQPSEVCYLIIIVLSLLSFFILFLRLTNTTSSCHFHWLVSLHRW